MKRAMFIGPIGCGKTTLMQRLKNETLKYDKTQVIEFSDNFIDTPGEYMEHHQMVNRLTTTGTDADIIVLLQSVVDRRLVYPAGYCSAFNKPCVGLVTKLDLDDKPADIEYSKKVLLSAGVKKVIAISAVSGKNIDKVHELLR